MIAVNAGAFAALPAAIPAARQVAVLAQGPPPGPADPGGRGDDFGKSSPLGLVLLLLFGIATVFLIRSMSKHLRRVPASFDPPPEAVADPVADRPVPSAGDVPANEHSGAERARGPADGP